MNVPFLTVCGLFLETLFTLFVPLIIIILYKKGHPERNLFSAYVGLLTFLVFTISLENRAKLYLLSLTSLRDSLLLFLLCIGISAVFFEEGGRYLALNFMLKKPLKKSDAVLFGLGFGATRSIALSGLPTLSYLRYAMMTNKGTITSFIAAYTSQEQTAILKLIESIAAIRLDQCLLGIIESLLLIGIEVGLSLLMYRASEEKQPLCYLQLLLVHFLLTLPSLLYQRAVLNIYLSEALLFVLGISFLFIIRKRISLSDDEPSIL